MQQISPEVLQANPPKYQIGDVVKLRFGLYGNAPGVVVGISWDGFSWHYHVSVASASHSGVVRHQFLDLEIEPASE